MSEHGRLPVGGVASGSVLFEPVQIAGATVPNRIVRAAHGTRLSKGSGVEDDLIAYHVARARGGVGLSVLEFASVHRSGPAASLQNWDDGIVPGYRRLADAVHEHGMLMFQQLHHGGHQTPPVGGGVPWAPSDVPSVALGITPMPMTTAQIDELVEAYGAAAARVQAGGLDGIEVHCAHGFLQWQFLSPLTNRRDDDYGGSAENRRRFLTEVLTSIRRAVGPAFPVGVRLSAGDGVPGGLTVQDVADIARALDEARVIDFLDVSQGSPLIAPKVVGAMHEHRGYELPTTQQVTRAVSVPTIVTGRIMNLAEAEAVVKAGQADLVSMVRATIADPELVAKTRRGLSHEVRPCISCNQGCVGGVYSPVPRIGCTVNPDAGQETRPAVPARASGPKRVLVVGGGPAGLECARTAALRGHQVTLCETRGMLGGQVAIARQAPHRADVGLIVDWLGAELNRLNVDVRCSTPVDETFVTSHHPDHIVIASGSAPRRDGFLVARPGEPVDGIHQPTVHTSWEVLAGEVAADGPVVVYDDVGHYEAIAAAEWFAERGVTVEFVTRHLAMAPLMEILLIAQPARERFGDKVRVHPRSQLLTVTKDHVTIRGLDSGVITTMGTACVVFVGYNRSVQPDLRLGDPTAPTTVIGDALSPRFLQTAIHEGRHAGSSI